METIFKYPLELKTNQIVKMKFGAKILCAQYQNKIPCLWCIVNPNEGEQDRHIEIVGTGYTISERHLQYIGTIQDPEYPLVWHVFERTDK